MVRTPPQKTLVSESLSDKNQLLVTQPPVALVTTLSRVQYTAPFTVIHADTHLDRTFCELQTSSADRIFPKTQHSNSADIVLWTYR